MSDTHSAANASGEEDRGRAEPGERMVPLSALVESRQERQALAQQVAELKGMVNGFTAATAAKTETPKVYTEAEIQAAVNKGTITEARANEIRARQIREEAVAEAKKAVKAELTSTQTATAIEAELGRYGAALPALRDDDSPVRAKANAAYQRLLNRGHEPGARTELAAIELAFGPVEALEAAKPRGERETHEETGGGSGRDRGNGSEGWPKDMPAKNRQYYEGQIAKGRYTRESAVKEWNGYTARRGKAA
jgi:hypothetical protein